MCVPLAIAAAGVAAAGQLMGGAQAMAQGNYASNVAKANAQTQIEAAHDSVARGQDEASQFYRQVGRTKGDQIAAIAANGIDVGYGSAERVQDDTQRGADADANRMYYNQEQRTKGLYVDANNFVAEAAAQRAKGKAALISSAFSAASSLMGGFTQNAILKARQGQPGGGPVLGALSKSFGSIG